MSTKPDPYPAVPINARRMRVRPKTRGNYTRTYNRVYAETQGIGLVMDVFVPESPNGRGLIDVVSTAWHSGRETIDEHTALGTFDRFCAQGFTVFAVCPGSATLFGALDMATHVRAALRYLKHHAAEWRIDPARLGMYGASAGGHLAALAALQPEEARPSARNPYLAHDTHVAALALIFPPTDLRDYGGHRLATENVAGVPVPRLFFDDGLAGKSQEVIDARLVAMSPARLSIEHPPPTLLVHGTADPLVPLSQSEKLRDVIAAAGGEAELWVKEGGGHPWPGIAEDIERLAQWFAERLK